MRQAFVVIFLLASCVYTLDGGNDDVAMKVSSMGYDGDCEVTCGENGTCVEDICSCFSGYAGANCTETTSCNMFLAVFPNRVDQNTEIISGSVQNSVLRLRLEAPFTIGRQNATISLGAASSFCTYPFSPFWTKTVEGCTDVYEFEGDFEDAIANCGFGQNSSRLFLTFFTTITVAYTEVVGQVQGVDTLRLNVQENPIIISLPQSISVFTDIVIDATDDILVETAVTLFDYDAIATLADVEFLVGLDYPYDAVNAVFGATPNGVSASNLTLTVGSCGTLVDSPCFLTLDFNLLPSDCDLSGEYNIFIELGCRLSGPDQERLCVREGILQLNFTVSTPFLCNDIRLDVGLSATLESFADRALTLPLSEFEENRIAYFGATVSADVDINSIVINRIDVVNGLPLFGFGGNTLAGNAIGLQVAVLTSTTATFSFLVSQPVIPLGNVRIGVVIDVNYEAEAVPRRMLLQLEGQQTASLEGESAFTISTSTPDSSDRINTPNGGNGWVAAFAATAGILAVLVGVLVVGGVLVMRKRGGTPLFRERGSSQSSSKSEA